MGVVKLDSLALVAVLFLVSVNGSCATARRDTLLSLDSTARALDDAAATFATFDHDYQLELVRSEKRAGKSSEQIETDLHSYRAKRVVVLKGFADARALIQTGRALIPVADSADLRKFNLDLFDVSQTVSRALAEIGSPVQLGAALAPPSDGGAR